MKISKVEISELVDQIYEDIIDFFSERDINIFDTIPLDEEDDFIENLKDRITTGITSVI